MAIFNRLTFALIGSVFGALTGVCCWWLYGLAHSLNYDGPGMDPALRHWVIYTTTAFAALGFIFRERIGDLMGDTISAIFQFETNDTPGERASVFLMLVFLAIFIATVWFTTPS